MKNSIWMSVAALGALALTACAPNPIIRPDGTVAPSGSGPSTPAGSCNVTNVGWAVGQVATPDVLQRIKKESGATTGRALGPSAAATTDFRADRVNVSIDANRKIQRVTCG